MQPCADLRDARNSGNAFYTAQVGSYAAASALFLGAAATYLLWPRSNEGKLAVIPYANIPQRSAGLQFSF